MGPSKEELKAQMMAKAEAAIDKLLAKKKPAEEISLTEIEQLALQAGAEIQQEVTSALVEASRDPVEVPEPTCPECGKPMRYKAHKKKRIVTASGEVEVERAYYYCAACKRGVFPPG
jgi:DNA repair exonuclease SbcCD ATPase subunit